MDRFAVFVDAGYLLSAGAGIVWEQKVPRSATTVEHRAFLEHLVRHCKDECSLDLLRVYWYDGATNQIPTTEHQAIGALAGVKVRLGRLVRGEQKGVDTLIVLDLTTLARERAIATAYLISGDEDLREGVAAAQQHGVRVVLLGLDPARGQHNQALTLIREADEHRVLDADEFIKPFFTRVATQETLVEVQDAQVAIPPKPVVREQPNAERIGREFMTRWIASGPPAEALESLRLAKKARPRSIPKALDAELLGDGRDKVANPLSDEQKRDLRRGFWSALT